MPVIHLHTPIAANIERCFDLSRSIELHLRSTGKTREEAVAGRTAGLIGLHETVTWRATHFGIRLRLTSEITAMDRPRYFRDEQIKGAFKKMIHDHYFQEEDGHTIMNDRFYFEAPLGLLGRCFNRMVLTDYLRRFLLERNKLVKTCAEGHGEDFPLSQNGCRP